MGRKAKGLYTHSRELGFTAATVPADARTELKPLKYEVLVRQFYESGHPSARVQATWDTEPKNEQARIQRAQNFAVAMRKVIRRLELPVGAVLRGAEVYLVREKVDVSSD